jgi:hypothetical protein
MVEKSIDKEVHGWKTKDISRFSSILVKGFSNLESPQNFISSYSIFPALGARKWHEN